MKSESDFILPNGWRLGKISLPAMSKSPDTDQANIRATILRILTSDKRPAQKHREITTRVCAVLQRRGRFYRHAELPDFDHAMFFDRQRRLLIRIRSDGFQAWLSDWLGINRADSLFKHVIAGVETASISAATSQEIVPEAYWAHRDGGIYLSNGDGQMARITAKGVEMVDNGSDGVLFAAGRTLLRWDLTTPVDPFESCAAFRGANYESTHGLDLLRLFAIAMPSNPVCKPPLALIGTVGSGKTRLARAVTEFYGLPFAAIKVDERKEGDFWPTLDAGGLAIFDNADTKVKWLADALASASTGGSAIQRRLYTNCDLVTLGSKAWIAVTSANPTFASDPGLADRVLVVRLGRRVGETADEALSREIAAQRNAGLSFIAHTLSRALAQTGDVPRSLNSRHPDFARFAVQIGRALGRETEVIAALRAAEVDKATFCIENSPVANALVTLVKSKGEASGTAAEMAERLKTSDDSLNWLNSRNLSKQLTSMWPHLATVIHAEKRTGHGGALHFTFRSRDAGNVTAVGTKSPELETEAC